MFSEIYDLLGIDSIGTEMCVTFVMNKGAVVQGYKKVVSISDTNIIVIGKNKRKIELVGKYLEIFSLAPSEIVVHGRVTGVHEYEQN